MPCRHQKNHQVMRRERQGPGHNLTLLNLSKSSIIRVLGVTFDMLRWQNQGPG